MKRNNLTTAVIAGLAGVAGVASISNAVDINNDGLGQVLIYPYYTVNCICLPMTYGHLFWLKTAQTCG